MREMSKSKFSSSLQMKMKRNTLTFSTTFPLLCVRRLWPETAQHEQLPYNVRVWLFSLLFVVTTFCSYNISCTKMVLFFRLSKKSLYFNCGLISSLQYSKQTHFHHRAFCKLQKLWNIIHCTAMNKTIAYFYITTNTKHFTLL
jgi:hypothetical protein